MSKDRTPEVGDVWENPKTHHRHIILAIGRVLQKLNGVLINIWKSQRDIVKTLGLGQAMLSMALTGKYKTAYGFEWEYENNIHENVDLLDVGGK